MRRVYEKGYVIDATIMKRRRLLNEGKNNIEKFKHEIKLQASISITILTIALGSDDHPTNTIAMKMIYSYSV